ncbi:MAG TPA: pseudouridine synthase [Flavipsychrobacter sp.]
MSFHYIAFHKPYRVLSQFSPEGDKETLADYLQGLPKDVYPVGRLDYDSEGLLLLTNDKNLNHQLTEPKFAHNRTYRVQVDGDITAEAIKKLAAGVTITVNGRHYNTLSCLAEKLLSEPTVPPRNPPVRYRANIPTSWISLTLTEGKNRQVRKMTAAVGFPTLRLIRYAIGRLTLDGIEPGSYTEYDESIKNFFMASE